MKEPFKDLILNFVAQGPLTFYVCIVRIVLKIQRMGMNSFSAFAFRHHKHDVKVDVDVDLDANELLHVNKAQRLMNYL